ncbi:MAG: PD40 domain-containing protein [Gemmatimonadaceae bacterium]|nr:PD40 domain-containing protein [Gemmatimonadaceae bacterium]
MLVVLGMTGSASLHAQVPLTTRLNTLQHPPGLSWDRLDAPHFTVIHPRPLGAEAQRVARLLEAAYPSLQASLGAAPPRIPVVLANQSMVANAYVAWSPRRSQWYTAPNPTVDAFGPMEWFTLLARHEGRHVVQQEAVRSGWVGLAARLFGDNTLSTLGSIYFPAWFWEGDAVGMETALSAMGRGRQPAFTARMRALTAEGAPYEYYPAWQGTYRTALPDWYEQGYVITSWVRRHYGDSAWRRVIRRATRNPLAPWALSMALKRETGRAIPAVHRAAVAEIDSMWREQRAAIAETPAEIRSPAAPDYRVWSQPQYAGDGSVIAAYSDLNTVSQIVRLRGDRREVLVERAGLFGDLQFHVRGDRAVWAEYEADSRWGERSYLVLKRLDLSTGKVTRLTDRSRYYGPQLSPDGQRIVAVEFTPERRSRLVILDAASGAVMQRLPDERATLVTPTFTSDGRGLLVVRIDEVRGNALVRVSLDGGAERTLIDYVPWGISRPQAVQDLVVFGSPRSGLDGIWAVDSLGGATWRVASRRFGASWPAPSADGRRLLFSDYGPRGYDIAEAPLDRSRFQPASDVPLHEVLFADSVVAQESRLVRVVPIEVETFPVRPFRGWSRAFDFHSRTIAPTSDDLNTGLAIESRNLLNTFGMNLGVTFNTNERTFAVETGASYAGWPVIVDGSARLGSRTSSFVDSAGTARRFGWDERSVNLAARLPLTRLNGQRRQSLVATVGVGLTDIANQPVRFRFDQNDGTFMPVSYVLAASHVRAAAFRDLFQTGVSAFGVYRHTPESSDTDSHIAALRTTAIVPGVFANHGIVLEAGHEEQRPTNYRFSSEVPFPRGFGRRYADRLTRIGVSYAMPLWYPDLAIGPLLYVRRVQGAVLGDAARASDRANTRVVQYRAVGGEVTADVAPFGTRSTMRLGVRLMQRLTQDRKAVAEFVLTLPQ